jgi:hypothetical protein
MSPYRFYLKKKKGQKQIMGVCPHWVMQLVCEPKQFWLSMAKLLVTLGHGEPAPTLVPSSS